MRRVALFAKRPVEGRVKTRLSPALPPALARDLYAAMLEDALAAVTGCGADGMALYWAPSDGDGDPPRAPAAAPTGAVRIAERIQDGPDLGARLRHAFAGLLRAPGDRAVVIGADCPQLDAATLRQAFDELDDHDVVLGPARDGGYYLVGLNAPRPGLFEGVAWSTGRVLGETLERAEVEDARVVLLRMLDDLDTPDDLVRLAVRGLSKPDEAPRTIAALRAMGLAPPAR